MASVPVAVRRTVYARDGHRCVYCGRSEEEIRHPGYMPGPRMMYRLTIDHLIPRVYGGTDDEWNFATACHRCNTSRQDKPWPRALELLAANLSEVLA